MITLKIKNWFQKDREYFEVLEKNWTITEWRHNESFEDCIMEYDAEKWKDGKVYEFETLKEVSEFCSSCDIYFTDSFEDQVFDENDYWVLSKNYYIDDSEDNILIFEIRMYQII